MDKQFNHSKKFILYTIIILTLIAAFLSAQFLLNFRSIFNRYTDSVATYKSGNLKAQTINPNTPRPININEDYLIQAGYSVIKQEIPSAGRYAPPNIYFRVKEESTPSFKSDTTNLVVIFQALNYISVLPNYGSNITSFPISEGQGQEGIMPDGRTAINFVKKNVYLVIIGPIAKKVEKLATIISDKI